MIDITTCNNDHDLQGILSLQQANLAHGLLAEEAQSQGYVTVHHSHEQLAQLNRIEKHIIIKAEEKVVGYLLAMTKMSRSDIPVLVPMFDQFEKIPYAGKPVSEYNYLVVGQACIDRAYRGQGLLDQCYAVFKQNYSHRYDFAITEIAADNPRSLQAHKRIGFKKINSYTSPGNVEWLVVVWDWHK